MTCTHCDWVMHWVKSLRLVLHTNDMFVIRILKFKAIGICLMTNLFANHWHHELWSGYVIIVHYVPLIDIHHCNNEWKQKRNSYLLLLKHILQQVFARYPKRYSFVSSYGPLRFLSRWVHCDSAGKHDSSV